MHQYITCTPDVVQINGESAVTYDFRAAGVQRTTLKVIKHFPPPEGDVEEDFRVEAGDDPLRVHADPRCTGITIEDHGPGTSDAAAIAVEPA